MMWRMVLPRHQVTSACTIARRVMDVSTGSSMLTRTAAGTAAGGGESALATVMRRAGTAATRAAPGAGMQSLRAGTERGRRRLRGHCWLIVPRLCVHVVSEISVCSWAQLKVAPKREGGGGERALLTAFASWQCTVLLFPARARAAVSISALIGEPCRGLRLVTDLSARSEGGMCALVGDPGEGAMKTHDGACTKLMESVSTFSRGSRVECCPASDSRFSPGAEQTFPHAPHDKTSMAHEIRDELLARTRTHKEHLDIYTLCLVMSIFSTVVFEARTSILNAEHCCCRHCSSIQPLAFLFLRMYGPVLCIRDTSVSVGAAPVRSYCIGTGGDMVGTPCLGAPTGTLRNPPQRRYHCHWPPSRWLRCQRYPTRARLNQT